MDVVRVRNRSTNQVCFLGLTRNVERPPRLGENRSILIGGSRSGIAPRILGWYPIGQPKGHEFVYHDGAAQPSDSVSGTWEWNLARSKYSPGPPPKSQTRTYEFSGETIKYTAKGIDADGPPTLVQYSASYDEKDHPMTGSPDSDAISLKRIDASTVEFTQKKGGTVVITGTRTTSKGGKVMTVTSKGTNAGGQPFNNVMVFEKR